MGLAWQSPGFGGSGIAVVSQMHINPSRRYEPLIRAATRLLQTSCPHPLARRLSPRAAGRQSGSGSKGGSSRHGASRLLQQHKRQFFPQVKTRQVSWFPVPLAEIACYKIQVECKMQLEEEEKKKTKPRQTGFADFLSNWVCIGLGCTRGPC